jgi:hypothetical protein
MGKASGKSKPKKFQVMAMKLVPSAGTKKRGRKYEAAKGPRASKAKVMGQCALCKAVEKGQVVELDYGSKHVSDYCAQDFWWSGGGEGGVSAGSRVGGSPPRSQLGGVIGGGTPPPRGN